MMRLICGVVIFLSAFLFYPASHAHAQNIGGLHSKADSLFENKQYAEAIVIYERILSRDPTVVTAYPAVVKCYNQLGDSQGALIFIESLFLDHPESGEVCYGLGYALFNNQKYKQAALYFDRALELNPQLAEAWNNRAAIYQFIEKDTVKARQFYEKAIALADQSGNQRVIDIARKNLAHIPPEEVLTPVTKALTLEQFLNLFVAAVEEQDEKAIRELILGQKHNCEQAMDWLLEQALDKSVQGLEDDKNSALLLVQILENEYRRAFNDLILTKKKERFNRLSDEERRLLVKAETLLEEGLALEQTNAFNDASERYKEALAGFKKLNWQRKIGITHVYLGDVYNKMDQYDAARRAYADALPFFDRVADAEYMARILASLGQTCFNAADYADALDNMEQSLKIYRQLKNEDAVRKLEKNIEVARMKLRN